jgi:hypothetical protein
MRGPMLGVDCRKDACGESAHDSGVPAFPNNVPSLSIIAINHASFAMRSCYALERRDGVGVKEEGGTGVKQDRPLDPGDFC